MKKEKAVLQRVYSYQGTCEERYALLAEVEHWMSSTDLVGYTKMPLKIEYHYIYLQKEIKEFLILFFSIKFALIDFVLNLILETLVLYVHLKSNEINDGKQSSV